MMTATANSRLLLMAKSSFYRGKSRLLNHLGMRFMNLAIVKPEITEGKPYADLIPEKVAMRANATGSLAM